MDEDGYDNGEGEEDEHEEEEEDEYEEIEQSPPPTTIVALTDYLCAGREQQ